VKYVDRTTWLLQQQHKLARLLTRRDKAKDAVVRAAKRYCEGRSTATQLAAVVIRLLTVEANLYKHRRKP